MENDLIRPVGSDEHNIEKLTSNELSNLLQDNGINAFGKKKKLLKLVKKHISKNKYPSNSYELTEIGEDEIKSDEWIDLYESALFKFDYNDYFRYLHEHGNALYKDSLKYIDKHITIANQNKDLKHLIDCYYAKAKIYFYFEKYELSMKWQLKNFILRVNPIYEYRQYYESELLFEYLNIQGIKSLNNTHLNIEKLFRKIWDEMNFKKEYITVDDAFSWLEDALKSDNLNNLSRIYEEKYLDM